MRKKYKIVLFVLPALFLSMTSCKKRKICAAYNSTFVYDDTNMGMFFTPFGNDSTPNIKKEDGRFNDQGLLGKSGKRNDAALNKYDTKVLKDAAKMPTDSLANPNDSMGAIINVKELHPEKVNTDQQAYDHYVGELLKKYQKDKPGGSGEPSEPDSSAYYNRSTKDMTPEEKKAFKAEKKARKQREKEEKRKAKEDAAKEEEEEFDFDLDELDN